MLPKTSPGRVTASVLGSAIALALAACSSGSTDTAPAAQPAAQTTPTVVDNTVKSVTISGVAAMGAPLAGAAIKVYDRTGALVCEQTAAADGSYTCDLGVEPKAPFVLVATLGETELASAFASATTSTVNITPITNLIASTLSTNGDPRTLVATLSSGGAPFTAASLQSAVERIVAALKPLTDALGTAIDPITGTFSADGTGYDKVLDAIQVTVRPNGTSSNIEITVKTLPAAEDSAPVSISFQSDATAIPPLPATISLGDVSGTNVQAAVAEFLARMTACYALPASQRVSDGTNVGSVVTADACKSLFSQDDPARFLSGGNVVGPASSNAFGSLFRNGPTGSTFDAGSFNFFRVNGDWVVSYRMKLPDTSTSPEQVVLRNEAGKLRLIGNQYVYGASVRSFTQLRDHLNQPDLTNLSVGYNIQIGNRTSAGVPIFAKVEVTSPRGNVITYKPTSGLSYLAIERSPGVMTGTPVVRLAGKLVSSAWTQHPKVLDTGLFFGDTTVFTDDYIRAMSDQGVWKMEFFHVDSSVPNVVQNYRTTARALTLAEASQVVFTDLTAPARAELVADTATTGYFAFPDAPGAVSPQFADLSANGNAALWQVPAGALAPLSVNIYGRAPSSGGTQGLRFNDGVNVLSSARTALIECSAQSVGDTHCAASPYRNQYATGSTVNSIEFFSRDQRGVEYSSMKSLYKVTPPAAL
jgi:hypothetical protein